MKIQSIQKKIKYLGYHSIFIYCFEVIYNLFLQLIYKFDKWHSFSPYHSRIYKTIVVDMVNKNISESSTVVDIGCGLGDIISRVNTNSRYGYDISNKIIKAAIFKNKKDINFHNGSILDVNSNSKIKSISILILVNWTHGIDGAAIVNDIKKLNKSKQIKFILVDELYKTTSKEPKFHNYSVYFNNFAKEIERQDDMESRNLVLFKVSNSSA